MNGVVYRLFLEAKSTNKKQLALLIDPDKYPIARLQHICGLAVEANISYIFIGGSLLVDNVMQTCVNTVKQLTNIPVILFPGSLMQIVPNADALLFLSLISGRNPDLLIGRHVEAAPLLRQTQLDVIATGYMLIDSGAPTTASYISHTFPIPHNKPDIAAATAIAGEMLGLKTIYMDAGSGAAKPISVEMISTVRNHINIPMIVGGGMRTTDDISKACTAGADIVVVGNILEESPELLLHFSQVVEAE